MTDESIDNPMSPYSVFDIDMMYIMHKYDLSDIVVWLNSNFHNDVQQILMDINGTPCMEVV